VAASVVQWSEFLATDTEVPDSIAGFTKFTDKLLILKRGPLSIVRIIEELLE
jgi:hypothetical protein